MSGVVRRMSGRYVSGPALPLDPRRFWRRVERPDANGCRIWTGAINRARGGYGVVQVKRWPFVQVWRTHRLAWTLVNGPIADGFHILHRCDNPPCCEPSHLFVGTNADNVADRIAKGRPNGGGCPPGEDCWNRKLSEADVGNIRLRYLGSSATQQELADEYGVAQTTVSKLLRGESWKETAWC